MEPECCQPWYWAEAACRSPVIKIMLQTILCIGLFSFLRCPPCGRDLLVCCHIVAPRASLCQERLKTRLLKMVIAGQSFPKLLCLHNHERCHHAVGRQRRLLGRDIGRHDSTTPRSKKRLQRPGSFLRVPVDVMIKVRRQVCWQVIRHADESSVAFGKRRLCQRVWNSQSNLRSVGQLHSRRQVDGSICDFDSAGHTQFFAHSSTKSKSRKRDSLDFPSRPWAGTILPAKTTIKH